jgi:hypothetical protein
MTPKEGPHSLFCTDFMKRLGGESESERESVEDPGPWTRPDRFFGCPKLPVSACDSLRERTGV